MTWLKPVTKCEIDTIISALSIRKAIYIEKYKQPYETAFCFLDNIGIKMAKVIIIEDGTYASDDLFISLFENLLSKCPLNIHTKTSLNLTDLHIHIDDFIEDLTLIRNSIE